MILGISGKKQSGKTTSGNFLVSIFIANLGIANKVHISTEGQIIVSDLFGNESYAGVFDICKPSNDFLVKQALAKLSPHIQLYSFADPLKQDICINILGLTWDQCYGSDYNKNTMTSLKWEDMPGYHGSSQGLMTAREVMEYVGTGIFRQIKLSSWVNGTINKILKEQPKLAVIIDCRFPNEIEAIKNHNGKVIRLSRSKYNSDSESESILDEKQYDWSQFDFIVRNDDMTIYEQCMEIQKILQILII
jgi:hypothetical protein